MCWPSLELIRNKPATSKPPLHRHDSINRHKQFAYVTSVKKNRYATKIIPPFARVQSLENARKNVCISADLLERRAANDSMRGTRLRLICPATESYDRNVSRVGGRLTEFLSESSEIGVIVFFCKISSQSFSATKTSSIAPCMIACSQASFECPP